MNPIQKTPISAWLQTAENMRPQIVGSPVRESCDFGTVEARA